MSSARSQKLVEAIALMYEAREADIDMEAANHHSIEVVGVNESHHLCGAFEFVGAIAVSALARIAWLGRTGRQIGV